MSKRHTLGKVLMILMAFALACVAVYSALRIVTTLVVPSYDSIDKEPIKTVVKDGVEYFPRQDISVVMVTGIDRSGPVKPSDSYNNNGSADMLALLVFDETAKDYTVLMLNRDTMTEIPVLGVNGYPAGTVTGQLALSHTYGTGLQDSSENVRTAVTSFLGIHTVNQYITLNMDSIGLMADLVGGVPVNVTDDFSAVDPALPKGEVLLKGKQALTFVQSRSGVGDQLNLSRMERQKVFAESFAHAAKKKIDNEKDFVSKMYDAVSPYMVTDCTLNSFSALFKQCSDYQLKEIISPQGENKQGAEYMEFYVDSAALQDLVLNLFYLEKTQNL